MPNKIKKNGRNRKRKARAPRRKQARRQAIPQRAPMLKVSSCCAKFAAALADPWCAKALGACLPIEPVRPSLKMRSRAVVSVTCGTNGVGFCLYSPAIGNDAMAYYYTTAAYTGTGISVALSGVNTPSTTGIVGGYFSDLPFSGSDYITTDTSACGRIVSVGMKATHTSNRLTRQGTWYTYASPDHADVNGIDPSSYAQLKGARILSVDLPVVTVTGGAVDTEEYDWLRPNELYDLSATNSIAYPWSQRTWFGNENLGAAKYGNGAAPFCICIAGGAAGQTFQVDLVANYEFAGKGVTGLTPSHTDSVAAKAVLHASSDHNTSSSTGSPFTMKKAFEGVKTVLKDSTEIVGGASIGSYMYQGAKNFGSKLLKGAEGVAAVAEEAMPLLLMAA